MRYHLVPIFIVITILFIISRLLLKHKKIKITTHRKIWNLTLLITFLISGGFGVLLVIKANFNLNFDLPINILFWHAEIGSAMVILSILHIWERWFFFKAMIKDMFK